MIQRLELQGFGESDEVVEGVDVADVLDGDDDEIGNCKLRHFMSACSPDAS